MSDRERMVGLEPELPEIAARLLDGLRADDAALVEAETRLRRAEARMQELIRDRTGVLTALDVLGYGPSEGITFGATPTFEAGG